MQQQREEYGRRGIHLTYFEKGTATPYFINLDEDPFRSHRFMYLLERVRCGDVNAQRGVGLADTAQETFDFSRRIGVWWPVFVGICVLQVCVSHRFPLYFSISIVNCRSMKSFLKPSASLAVLHYPYRNILAQVNTAVYSTHLSPKVV